MSVKWTCDYPECGEASEGHEHWTRYEYMPEGAWWIFAMPIIGNIVALIIVIIGRDCYHYCPEHAKFLKGGR